MKLSDFKKELKKRNVSYTAFVRNVLEHQSMPVYSAEILDEFLRVYTTFEDALVSIFPWDKTPEGIEFWDDIHCGGICISPRGAIFQDYAISTIPRSHTGSWSIGSSVLTTARKRKLFKLLAKDLGYKIEG